MSMVTGVGQPTHTMVPPGAQSSGHAAAANGLPEHSMTTSTPAPFVASRICSLVESLLAVSTLMPWIFPGTSFSATSSLFWTGSARKTLAHPDASAVRHVSIPMGPAPTTHAISPGLIWALVQECMPTASGSTRAASSNETWSGILNVKLAGCTTDGRRHPWPLAHAGSASSFGWYGGVAQNRTSGSTLYMPLSVSGDSWFGIPGSMQTRSPTLRCSTFDPTSVTTPLAS
mmetsp:Transcript_1985/g.6225  ORF Transcript_1985/g.6225 Transcript_1985/m.6225 type:complete len:230 (-) Transcript_1985:295-984(-)